MKTETAAYTSRLHLDKLGRIPKGRASSFFRVETARNGRFVADFTLESEAKRFAVEDARAKGCRYDHTVSRIIMRGR